MIRIGRKYVRGSEVNMVVPDAADPDNWSRVLFADGTWADLNAPAAVVVDRIHLAEVCADVNCKEDHDA